MSDVNWDLAPKDATEIRSNGNIMRFFNKRNLFYNGAMKEWKLTQYLSDWQTIATRPQEPREEYEKARGEKAEQEWTHRTNAGELCKIHVKEPDVNGVIIVLNERGEYLRHNSDSLKPIKPQITKAKAWDMLNEKASTVNEFRNALVELQDKYDVVDESIEVQS